jgi:hypothetical protein
MSLKTQDRRCPKCKVVTPRHADGKCATCSRRRALAAKNSWLSIRPVGRPKKLVTPLGAEVGS